MFGAESWGEKLSWQAARLPVCPRGAGKACWSTTVGGLFCAAGTGSKTRLSWGTKQALEVSNQAVSPALIGILRSNGLARERPQNMRNLAHLETISQVLTVL